MAEVTRLDVWRAMNWGKNLSGLDLSGLDLSRLELSEASLRKTNLRGADLRGASLNGSKLNGADLSGARQGFSCGAPVTDLRNARPESVPVGVDLKTAGVPFTNTYSNPRAYW